MNFEQLQPQFSTPKDARGRPSIRSMIGVLLITLCVGVSSCSQSTTLGERSADAVEATSQPASVGEQVLAGTDGASSTHSNDNHSDPASNGLHQDDNEGHGQDQFDGSASSNHSAQVDADALARIHEMQDPRQRSTSRGITLTSSHGIMATDQNRPLSESEHTHLLGMLNDLLDVYGDRLTAVFASRDVTSPEFLQQLERWYDVVDPASPLARDITGRIVQTIGEQGEYLQPEDEGRSFRHVGFQISPTPKFEPQDPDLWLFHWCGRAHSSTVSITTGAVTQGAPVAMRGYGIMANQNGRYWIRDLEVASHEQVDALPSLQCSR